MTVRVLVVDDEPLARGGLARLVAATPGFEVAGQAADGEGAVAAIEALRPDLVLLDVAMPGCDGFEVVRRVGPARMPPVVFVTAHDEWALRAFEANALGYVLKPFEDARLREALVRAAAPGQGPALAAALAALLAPPAGPHFEVRLGSSVRLVPVADVEWIEGSDYYATLHAGGETHLVRQTLQAIEARLDPARFLRVHRSAIVQLARVREWRAEAGELVLGSGVCVAVSRSRRAALRRALRAGLPQGGGL